VERREQPEQHAGDERQSRCKENDRPLQLEFERRARLGRQQRRDERQRPPRDHEPRGAAKHREYAGLGEQLHEELPAARAE
jgi:hypothetical protein